MSDMKPKRPAREIARREMPPQTGAALNETATAKPVPPVSGPAAPELAAGGVVPERPAPATISAPVPPPPAEPAAAKPVVTPPAPPVAAERVSAAAPVVAPVVQPPPIAPPAPVAAAPHLAALSTGPEAPSAPAADAADGWTALTEAQAAFAHGFEEIASEMSGMTRSGIAAASEAAVALLSARTFAEAVEINAGLVRRGVDAMIDGSTKLSEIGVAALTEASRPILSRFGIIRSGGGATS
jgi:resuscitation-promoting factor RpfA